jgi:hypothetical protein
MDMNVHNLDPLSAPAHANCSFRSRQKCIRCRRAALTFVIPGRATGQRFAPPDGANPESRSGAPFVWIPGSREDANPGMTGKP